MQALQDFSRNLCREVGAWTFNSLPASAVRTAKLFLLDTLGVIGAASRADGIPALNRRIHRWDQGGTATGLLGKRALSPLNAALVNGAAAHALDFDDQHDPARVHAYCVALPAILAAAEDSHADGKTLLLGLATAVELHARLGLACHESLRAGWQPTVSHGGMAAALGVGKLLALTPDQLLGALGLAYHQAAGNSQSLFDDALSKRIGPGFAARAGLHSAYLRLDGMTGPTRPLEGAAGLFQLYERGEVRTEALTSKLGSEWQLLNYSVKPYPCCRCNHSVIDLAREFRDERIAAEDIEAVEVWVGRVNQRIIGTPYDAANESIVHAQFNAAFSFARAFLDGKFDLHSLTAENRRDSRVAALAARVRVLDDPAVDANAIEPVRIELKRRGGSASTRRRTIMRGGPQEPLSEAEILHKFRANLEYGLAASAAEAERLIDVVMTLDGRSDAGRAISGAFPQEKT